MWSRSIFSWSRLQPDLLLDCWQNFLEAVRAYAPAFEISPTKFRTSLCESTAGQIFASVVHFQQFHTNSPSEDGRWPRWWFKNVSIMVAECAREIYIISSCSNIFFSLSNNLFFTPTVFGLNHMVRQIALIVASPKYARPHHWWELFSVWNGNTVGHGVGSEKKDNNISRTWSRPRWFWGKRKAWVSKGWP